VNVVALYSMKGGVGKTATAANLAYLASRESRTLLWDLDPQASVSYYFRVKPKKKLCFKNLLKGYEELDRYVRETDHDNLHLLPAKLSHRKTDFVLKARRRPREQLLSLLSSFPEDYGIVILDCPPNMSLLSENVFAAADVILVPVVPTTLSLLSYETILKFFHHKNLKEKRLVPFFSMVEPRKTMHRECMARMEHAKPRFMQSRIPYSADVERMGMTRSPVNLDNSASLAAKSYTALWKELKERALDW
jgi:cellulose biosynthesis protein BcsQ